MRAKEGHRWRNPVWRHEDGSVAEWRCYAQNDLEKPGPSPGFFIQASR
jgi:hypothetical protein